MLESHNERHNLPPFCLTTIKGIVALDKFHTVSAWAIFAGGHFFLGINAEALDSAAIEVVLTNVMTVVEMTGRCVFLKVQDLNLTGDAKA
jgi:hypothetical protein